MTTGLAGSNGSTAGFMTHVTCRLTAKNLDQLRNPTLGNRVWATFTLPSCIRIVLGRVMMLRVRALLA